MKNNTIKDLVAYVYKLFNIVDDDIFIIQDITFEVNQMVNKSEYLLYLRNNFNIEESKFKTKYQKFIFLSSKYKKEMIDINENENQDIYVFVENFQSKLSNILDTCFENQVNIDFGIKYEKWLKNNLNEQQFEVLKIINKKYSYLQLINFSNNQIYKLKNIVNQYAYQYFANIKKEKIIKIKQIEPPINNRLMIMLNNKGA